MKKLYIILAVLPLLVSCSFLETPPALGITEDKLIDLKAMRAIVNGSYNASRGVLDDVAAIDMLLVRDMCVRNKPEWDSYFEHQMSSDICFGGLYKAISIANELSIHDVQSMDGTKDEKDVILGEMYFMRALLYFIVNTHYELPSTGWSAPLVLKPVEINDRLSCAKASDIRMQIEKDIEQARVLLKGKNTVLVDYYAATALAARIYFYHENYLLAYQCANEVITSSKYVLEDVSAPFIPLKKSKENIFEIAYNSVDNISPVDELFVRLLASDTQGALYVNDKGELKTFFDVNDKRYQTFFKEQDNVIYGSEKYSTDKMNYPYIRLAEMYLTRAEANIMNTGSVSQQDVDDVNKLIERSLPANVLTSIPSKDDMLECLYRERTREMALEVGDHFLNVKRLKRGIVSYQGDGYVSYAEYADKVVSIFPDTEMAFHDLNRNR